MKKLILGLTIVMLSAAPAMAQHHAGHGGGNYHGGENQIPADPEIDEILFTATGMTANYSTSLLTSHFNSSGGGNSTYVSTIAGFTIDQNEMMNYIGRTIELLNVSNNGTTDFLQRIDYSDATMPGELAEIVLGDLSPQGVKDQFARAFGPNRLRALNTVMTLTDGEVFVFEDGKPLNYSAFYGSFFIDSDSPT